MLWMSFSNSNKSLVDLKARPPIHSNADVNVVALLMKKIDDNDEYR